jgi:cytochrome c peroxidase
MRIQLALVAASTLCASMSVTAVEPVQPIYATTIEDRDKVELGKMLFFDPRLSQSGFISCNSCHNLSMGGSDNLPTSIGHDWQLGPINSPTVLNSKFNIAQFWDGRAASLKEQAGGPIANPGEMAFTHELALGTLETIPGYVKAFEKVYGDEVITIDEVTDAIAVFEETLVTPGAPFDRYLMGDEGAISTQAKAGYELFKTAGCTACHNGQALGGSSFQKMGLVKPYKTDSQVAGRSAVTGKEIDRFSFKVPTLRNIELTYPYFHDGAVWDLGEAVNIMGEIQLGREFKPEETDQIVAFLNSLTGQQPTFDMPILPPSSAKTPKPQP